MLAPTRTRRFWPSISRTMLGVMGTFLTSGFFSAFGVGAAARAAGAGGSAGSRSQPTTATASSSDRNDNPERRKQLLIMASTAELQGAVRAGPAGTFSFILTEFAGG